MLDESLEEKQEMAAAFVAETADFLEGLEADLLEIDDQVLNGERPSGEILNRVFRGFHSMKGTAIYLELRNLARLAHLTESLLDDVRKEKVRLVRGHLRFLFEVADLIEKGLAALGEAVSDVSLNDAVAGLVQDFGKIGKEEMSPLAEAGGVGMKPPGKAASETSEESDLLADMQALATALEADLKQGQRLERVPESWVSGMLPLRARIVNREVAVCFDRFMDMLDEMGPTRTLLTDPALTFKVFERFCLLVPAPEVSSLESLSRLLDVLDAMDQENAMAGTDTESRRRRLGETLLQLGMIDETSLRDAVLQQERRLGEVLMDMGALEKHDLDLVLQVQKNRPPKEEVPQTDRKQAQVRVDQQRLETLGNLLGELVTSENILCGRIQSYLGLDLELNKSLTDLRRVIREIQLVASGLQMVPLRSVFQRVKRLVKDLAYEMKKDVLFELEGEHIEVDRKIAEGIYHPLVHLVRNGLDHGIESPDERETAGKPRRALMTLSAKEEVGEVVLSLSEDGRGLQRERILEKAEEKGLTGHGHVLESDRDIFNLIFEPGFSTAKRVTEISGRGVGMDVVRRNVELDLGGSIFVDSEAGKGTTFRMMIPPSVSIIDGMVVKIGEQMMLVPLNEIEEVFSMEGVTLTSTASGAEVIRRRDAVIPMVRIAEFFRWSELSRGKKDGSVVILVKAGESRRALLFDQLWGMSRVTVKRSQGVLRASRGVSGFAVLSGGEVALILNVRHLIAVT